MPVPASSRWRLVAWQIRLATKQHYAVSSPASLTPVRLLSSSSSHTSSERPKGPSPWARSFVADDAIAEAAVPQYESPPAPLGGLERHRVPMQPFVKNLFVGKFDKQLLWYADVLDNERYFQMDSRCKRVSELLSSKSDLLRRVDADAKISKDVLLPLRSLADVHGMHVPKEYGGQGLGATETARVLEELSLNMSVSETLAADQFSGVKALLAAGNERQKAKYLPKIASGEWTAALCIKDRGAGSDPFSSEVSADFEEVEDTFILSGTKTWVLNGSSADLLTVFAHVRGRLSGLTAFIVERNSPGVSVSEERIPTVGLRGLAVCRVTFDRTPVPAANVIGEVGDAQSVLMKCVECAAAEDKFYTAARIAASLHHLINFTIKHAIQRKQFGRPLAEFDQIKDILGSMSARLFALRTMIYMSTGLADVQAEPDVGVEAAICKVHAVETSRFITHGCSSILGSLSFIETEPANVLMRDLQAYEFWDGTVGLLKNYIALAGLQQYSDNSDEIAILRRPLENPFAKLRHMWEKFRHLRNNPKLTLELEHNVHPSLQQPAAMLEYCVLRLAFVSEQLLIRHGYNTQLAGVHLARLADVAADVFAMTCVIARANRSYCDGHEHAEQEIFLAGSYVQAAVDRCRTNLENVLVADMENCDRWHANIAEYLVEKGCYPYEHPTTKNIF